MSGRERQGYNKKCVFVFGFKPYLSYRDNITERIIKKFPRRKNITTAVFPVQFNRFMFLRTIRRIKPDIIIGIGQHPRARKIRIERRAFNLKAFPQRRATKIDPIGPRYVYVNYKLKSDKISCVTYNAGSYVCNFALYVVADFVRKNNIRFAFLHIPQYYDVQKVIFFITRIMNTV